LSANIYGMDGDIQNRKTNLLTAISYASDEKSSVNFGPLTTAFMRLMFTHQIDFFWKTIFRPLGVLCHKIFALEND